MPKLNANITMMFQEVDFLERFEKAAKAGFKGVEYLFPYAYPKEQLAELLTQHNLVQVLHNLPAGDWNAGDRGVAVDPNRKGEFQEGVGSAIEYAKALKCPQLNCLVAMTPPNLSDDQIQGTLVENLRFAAEALGKESIKLLVEPLNSQDMKGFYLVHTQDALDVFDKVGHPNLFLQYDIYHMQIMEGNLIKAIQTHLSRIAHLQLADVPGRHEPGTGEINYPNVFRAIDATDYAGWIGCEYIPAGKTEDGLDWTKPYL